jgi:hypothetical protein
MSDNLRKSFASLNKQSDRMSKKIKQEIAQVKSTVAQ